MKGIPMSERNQIAEEAGIFNTDPTGVTELSGDVLAGWNDGVAKRTVVDFVTDSVTAGSARFVPEAERIAAFDNDGTLWVEQPAPVPDRIALREAGRAGQSRPISG